MLLRVVASRWLWLIALAGLIALASVWTEAAEPVVEKTPDGQRATRWGFNPVLPTDLEDPPVPNRELPADYRIEEVLSGLERPTHMDVLPDGRLLVAEQAGDVRVVEDGRLQTDPFVSVDVYLPDLDGVVELGLTGILVDAEFDEYPFIYLYYAADGPRRSVIARVPVEDGQAGDPAEIFRWEVGSKCCHIGGGMQFLKDGTFIVGMGDHERIAQAQDPRTPPGSILRLTRTGSWPDDNPFLSWVYAYGLRNPYDVAVDPATGRIFSGDNGFFGQDAIVVIEAGANYGWPGAALNVPLEEIHDPLIFYHQAAGIAGMEFYSSDVLDELQGQLLFCRFHDGSVHAVEFNADGSVLQETIVARPCHSDLVTGPEGFLYFLDYVEGALHRIAR